MARLLVVWPLLGRLVLPTRLCLVRWSCHRALPLRDLSAVKLVVKLVVTLPPRLLSYLPPTLLLLSRPRPEIGVVVVMSSRPVFGKILATWSPRGFLVAE